MARWVVLVPPAAVVGFWKPAPSQAHVVDAPSIARALQEVARRCPPSEAERVCMALVAEFEQVAQVVFPRAPGVTTDA